MGEKSDQNPKDQDERETETERKRKKMVRFVEVNWNEE